VSQPVSEPAAEPVSDSVNTAASWRVLRPDRARYHEALERLVGGTDEIRARASAQRLAAHLDCAGRRGEQLATLASMVDQQNRIRLTALAVPGMGRTAQVLVTTIRDAAGAEALGLLLREVCEGLDPRQVAVAQALLDAEPRAEVGSTAGAHLASTAPDNAPRVSPHAIWMKAAFERAGFTVLAVLDYMTRPVPERRTIDAPTLPDDVSLGPWRRGDPILLRILESTYVDTLDCPGLCGLRRTEDILEGHLASARYEPPLWTVLRVDDRPAGALLLSPSHRSSDGLGSDDCELVYLGLAPWARGRGLGRLLLQHGLAQLSCRSERRITLAVDRANLPAVALYSSMGFLPGPARLALIMPVR